MLTHREEKQSHRRDVKNVIKYGRRGILGVLGRASDGSSALLGKETPCTVEPTPASPLLPPGDFKKAVKLQQPITIRKGFGG